MESKQEFATEEEYIQALADEYIKIKRELYTWQEKEKELILLIEAETKEESKTTTLEGIRDSIKVEKRDNVSYPKEKDREHPLRILLPIYNGLLRDKIRISYEESGSKIKDLIDRVVKGKPHTDEEKMLVLELEKVRVVKKGKPGISIVERKK